PHWGAFARAPVPGQRIIPWNYANGPGFIVANLRLMRRFNFGPKLPDPPAPPSTASVPAKDAKAPASPAAAKPGARPEKKEIERRYTWGIGIGSENILNHRNLAQPVGVLGSP